MDTKQLHKWFIKQFGRRPSRSEYATLQRNVNEARLALLEAEAVLRITTAWDEKWKAVQYTRNMMEDKS